MALIHRPAVLILDEPTIGLDPAQVVEIRNVIREIGKDRTVLLSTHILSEAQQICDRVLIINKGKIVAEDTPENLQSRLAGAQRVILRVRGDSDGLAATVGEVKGSHVVDTKQDGAVEFEFSAGQDVRPQVAKAVIEAGFDLLEMRPIGLSLEEIFLELTRDTAGSMHAKYLDNRKTRIRSLLYQPDRLCCGVYAPAHHGDHLCHKHVLLHSKRFSILRRSP